MMESPKEVYKEDKRQKECSAFQKYVLYVIYYTSGFGLQTENFKYEGWNFNFGNTPLDWIQELLE